MFDRLFDFVYEFLDLFQFWVIIDQYEEAVVLRFGKYNRSLKPGLRFIIPFGIEEVHADNVVPCSMPLSEQMLVTKDDRRILLSTVLMWRIFDIRRCLLDVEDAEDTLADIALGYVAEAVGEADWDEIRTKRFRNGIKKSIQKTAREWGITVYTVKFKDITEARTLRVVT
mgnify:CR=1 FL=1